MSYPRARKRFGQHFLEPVWSRRIVEAVGPRADDTFLEIGPGRGALTRLLATAAGAVIAVELDRDLAAALEGEHLPGVRVVAEDFLQTNIATVLKDYAVPVRVIGNLPYNVAAPMLFRLVDQADDGRKFSDATLMLQQEVAQRLVAAPGTKAYGPLTLQVQLLADTRAILTLPPGAFRPAPQVTSTVVQLRFRPPTVDVHDRAAYRRMVRGVFLHRRKTLRNALLPVVGPQALNVSEVVERAGVDGSNDPKC